MKKIYLLPVGLIFIWLPNLGHAQEVLVSDMGSGCASCVGQPACAPMSGNSSRDCLTRIWEWLTYRPLPTCKACGWTAYPCCIPDGYTFFPCIYRDGSGIPRVPEFPPVVTNQQVHLHGIPCAACSGNGDCSGGGYAFSPSTGRGCCTGSAPCSSGCATSLPMDNGAVPAPMGNGAASIPMGKSFAAPALAGGCVVGSVSWSTDPVPASSNSKAVGAH